MLRETSEPQSIPKEQHQPEPTDQVEKPLPEEEEDVVYRNGKPYPRQDYETWLEELQNNKIILSAKPFPDECVRYIDQADIIEVYKRGLPIAQEQIRHTYDSEELKKIQSHQLKEVLDSLVEIDKVSSDEKQRILETVLPFLQIKDLVFHDTPIGCIPTILHFGLLARSLTNKATRIFFRGFTKQSSGWGLPYLGDKFIDVHDPWRSFNTYLWIGKSITKLNNSPNKYPNKFEFDENFNIRDNFGGYIYDNPRHCRLIIKLNNLEKRLFRVEDDRGKNVGSYVKYRIKPEEIIGIATDAEGLAGFSHFISAIKGINEQSLTNFQLIEMLGSVAKRPIYDGKGNLLWPKRITYEEIKELVAERDRQKKEETKNQNEN